MWHPTHVDGRTLVIISAQRSSLGGYRVIESGVLSHDGEAVQLVGDRGSRAMTAAELESLQPVARQSGIAVCSGFDFFLLRP